MLPTISEQVNWSKIQKVFADMQYRTNECNLWLHPNITPTSEVIYIEGSQKEYMEYYSNFFSEKNFVPWWDREFSVSVHKVCSGPACGKQNLVFKNKAGFTVGCVQPTYLDFGSGISLIYIAGRSYKDYKTSACYTLADAFDFLGVSNIDLRDLEVGFDREFYK